MANTFKNAALANVSNSSYQTLYTAPANTQTVILGLAIANKSSSAVTVQVQFRDSSASADFQLLENVSIPANTTLETLAGADVKVNVEPETVYAYEEPCL